MRFTIILPTYNERENIKFLFNTIEENLKKSPHHFDILVVDDNSPDGTSKLVINEMKKRDNLHLINGVKRGLGVAYTRGIIYAREKLAADVVIEMDADFSHDPADIIRLVAEIDKGADFVIGSRYVSGGSVPKNWNVFRKLVSYVGNIFARYVAGISEIKDCTSGFRAIRTKIFDEIALTDLKAKGYVFQINLLYKASLQKIKIIEIPIQFKERRWGKTKLGLNDIIEFMVNSFNIRTERGIIFQKHKQLSLKEVSI